MLVGLIGKAESGKSTAANYLVSRYGFSTWSFASELKRVCSELFGLTDDQYTTEGKHRVDPRYGVTPRKILQFIGTDCFRTICPDVWVNRLGALLDRYNMSMPYPPDCVIEDVRFANEVRMIRGRGGVIIKMVRLDHKALSGSEAKHASEIEMDQIVPDKTIEARTGEMSVIFGALDRLVNAQKSE